VIGLVLALAVQVSPPPSYLVERVVSSETGTRRVSVFRDGTAVLVVRPRVGEPRLVKTSLTQVEFGALLQVVEEAYRGLEQAAPSEAPGEATVELRLAPPGHAPLIVRYALSAVPTVGAVRAGQAMDALETRLASPHPTREDLSGWLPQVGDRVELEDGRVVEVTDVLTAGAAPLIRVRVGQGPVVAFFKLDELRRLAVRRLP
jgi:hypothetical protein